MAVVGGGGRWNTILQVVSKDRCCWHLCVCVPCNKTLVYSSNGKKSRRVHATDATHKAALKGVLESYQLSEETTDGRKAMITTRVLDIKAAIGCFIAEHSLPYSIAPHLVALSKKLASDPDALHATKMGRTAATYVMTHGIAEEFKNALSDKLKSSFFSLNVDEATNNAGNKVLNVLVQYFDEDQQSTVVELLGSREVNQATS